ncbi:hypothetical protein GCM10009304_01760 [Pseudomonas matsuisoli]|uniref:Uncharacterized protein n=1 Tax=Pseudomonas matsuisoli TaxID=1515666 RepID=A0A917PHU0_9PSED|nr:hypothetical protein GCM10009304_01760 [Pseudomonas matsuisoli]
MNGMTVRTYEPYAVTAIWYAFDEGTATVIAEFHDLSQGTAILGAVAAQRNQQRLADDRALA